MKYFNFKRHKFSTMFKNIYAKTHKYLKIFKIISLKDIFNKLNNFIKFFKYFSISKYKIEKFYKYFDPREYDFNKIKRINSFKNKFILMHLPAAIIFFGLLYLSIPIFFNYEKSKIEKIICSYNKNLECEIKGKVSYNFFPSPKINIKNLIILLI